VPRRHSSPTDADPQELIEKLEKTEAKLAQTELDLASEQNVRRTLQSEVQEAKTTLHTEVVAARSREDALVLSQVRPSPPTSYDPGLPYAVPAAVRPRPD
jgi:hypothetical protein